jgi:hypothetical protein
MPTPSMADTENNSSTSRKRPQPSALELGPRKKPYILPDFCHLPYRLMFLSVATTRIL